MTSDRDHAPDRTPRASPPGTPLPPELATSRFEGLSVILPVIDESRSLVITVDDLMRRVDADVRELLILVCDRTTRDVMVACDDLRKRLGDRVEIHRQVLPFLGGAVREAFELARASHVIMMASDLETDPAVVPRMIELARERPDAIVTASRWAEGGSFADYGPLRVRLNGIFQTAASLLYGTALSDLTYGFRLLPARLVKAIEWTGLRHEFLLETVLRPLRLGVEVIEVPARWVARAEGESQNTTAIQLRYVRTLIQCRLTRTRLRTVSR